MLKAADAAATMGEAGRAGSSRKGREALDLLESLHRDGDNATAQTLSVSALPGHTTTLRADRQPAGGAPEVAGSSPTTTVSVVEFSPLIPGVRYEFWLVGVNHKGEGPPSNHVMHSAT